MVTRVALLQPDGCVLLILKQLLEIMITSIEIDSIKDSKYLKQVKETVFEMLKMVGIKE